MIARRQDDDWEEQGEEWKGDTLNPDRNARGEEWKYPRKVDKPALTPAPHAESQQNVHPDAAKYAAGWESFRQRELRLPLAYHHPAKRWTHLPAPTPAPEFPSLDAWLKAERTGKLTDVPLYEPYSFTATDAAWYLGIIPEPEVQIMCDRLAAARAKRYENPWPRVCWKCGAEFRPKAGDDRQLKAKRVRCANCRKGVAA